MNAEDIRQVIDSEFALAYAGAGPFGLWINALWPPQPDISYDDKRGIFLSLLRRLIESGRVVLFIPNGVPHHTRSQAGYDDIWAVPTSDMIRHIETHWPARVRDENDPELNYFWYDPALCPRLGWVDPDTGEIVAS